MDQFEPGGALDTCRLRRPKTALGFANRAALSFGGVEPGDYARNLKYNKDRIFAFVLALGEVDEEKYAAAAGAISYGFPTIADTPIPLALVAHDGEEFLGTASVIASDLKERPQLTPWIAAVWVEPRARQRGVGSALVNRATQDCFALGFSRAYLCARPQRSALYERLGWIPIERDLGPHQLIVFIRDANPAGGGINRSPP